MESSGLFIREGITYFCFGTSSGKNSLFAQIYMHRPLFFNYILLGIPWSSDFRASYSDCQNNKRFQVFTDNEPANARLATDGSSRLTKSEMWKDCAKYLNTVILDNMDKFGNINAMITHGDASQKFRNLKKTYLQKKAKSRETGKNDELKAMRHYQAFSDLYR